MKLATVGLCAKPCSHCTTSILELGFCPYACIRKNCIKWVMQKPHQTVCEKMCQDNRPIDSKCMGQIMDQYIVNVWTEIA